MLQQTSNETTAARERHTARVIHYDLSYILQGAEHGTDGAIVLLHDIPAGAFEWENALPQLAATNRAVYAIDMLGYGLSEFPWPSDTSIWGHADALSFLFNQLNLTNIVLVGHGLGGSVAQVLATRLSRSRVAALVLIDTYCYEYAFSPDWPLADMKKAQDPDLPQHTSVEDVLNDLKSTLPDASSNADQLKQAMNPWIDQWNSHLGKEMLYQHVRLLIPSYSNSVASDLKVMGKPTLIIWGEKDQQVPLKYAQRLHREIPESRLVIIPGAGHMVLFDAADQVASALADFVGQL
ncbi:MAG TPA: alpha/beta hydrolase [Ktedonobacteraceae bacterium]|nr:alpha/beta hydrolase [Ktedonobacteraceae bacterium]